MYKAALMKPDSVNFNLLNSTKAAKYLISYAIILSKHHISVFHEFTYIEPAKQVTSNKISHQL